MIRANLNVPGVDLSTITTQQVGTQQTKVAGESSVDFTGLTIGKYYLITVASISTNIQQTVTGLDNPTRLTHGQSNGSLQKPCVYIGKATATTVTVTAPYGYCECDEIII